MLFRGVVGVLVVPLLCGCVSYEEYRGIQDELSRSKRNNNDLITQYQKDLLYRQKTRKEFSSRDGELQTEMEELKNQLLVMESKKEELEKVDGRDFEKEDLPAGAKIESGGISLGSNLLFRSGQARLKTHQFPSLDQVARLLKGKYSSYEVLIEGHTDNEPLKSTRQLFGGYNIVLGYERASNVFRYLSKKHGIPENRFQVMSYGLSRPLNPAIASTSQGRSENRRVVFRLKRNIH
jgi:chemotaxis protein MotB